MGNHVSAGLDRAPTSHLVEIQAWLANTDLAGCVVPSTDEFLSEFPPARNRRLFWATGFRGSTGVAVVLRGSAAIFLDGRYRVQGAEDTEGSAIEVRPGTAFAWREWLKRQLKRGDRLAVDPALHSAAELTQWRSLATELGLQLEQLPQNPIDVLWCEGRPGKHRPLIVDYPESYAGETSGSKCSTAIEHIRSNGMAGLLLADPEDVSWLLNARAEERALMTGVGEWHVVPSCTSRVLISDEGTVTWFVDRDRLTHGIKALADSRIKVASPDTLVHVLQDLARRGPIGADPRRTPAALISEIERSTQLVPDDSTARRRWCKHPAEVECARQAHRQDAVAVVRLMSWLSRTVGERSVTEFEAAERLEKFRAENPLYRGPSMPLMSASGPSGAQPHYVPKKGASRRLNDHPLFWLDSGGHYPGGTTDNTLALAVSTPEPKHVLAHTRILQGLIALSMTRFPSGISAIRLDTIARQPLWREGMDFEHSTGHGVGNYLNIHEGPLIGPEAGPVTTAVLEPGMIVSNEPAYYAPGDFGVRIETHMLVIRSAMPSFLEFETISRLPIDPTLIDFAQLSGSERQWLAAYHRVVLDELEGMLDGASAAWLQSCVAPFIRASEH